MASSLASIAETWPENVLPCSLRSRPREALVSRKSHCVRKIKLVRILIYLGPDGFSAHLRNFLQVLDLHIFRQKQPGHWAEVVCHFHLPLNLRFIRLQILRMRINGLSKGDQWSLLRRPLERKPRTPWPSLISHRNHRNHRFFFLKQPFSVSSVSSVWPFYYLTRTFHL